MIFFSYAYFYGGAGWNQNSRFDLVRAIVEQGTLRIDAYDENTGDKAFANGHYYSDKAPGLALLAVPIAVATRPLLRAAGVNPASPRGLVDLAYWATVFAVALPMAAACACLFWIALQLGSSRERLGICRARAGAGNSSVGILDTVLGTRAGGSVFGVRLRLRSEVTRRCELCGGCVLGIGSWSDCRVGHCYGIPFSASRSDGRCSGACSGLEGWGTSTLALVLVVGAGALPCVVALMAYQHAAFGSVFHPSYAYYPQGAFSWMTPWLPGSDLSQN